jgi:hypothetical protein
MLKLNIVVSNRSIRRYCSRRLRPGDHQRWGTFLANPLRGIWAADIFVIQTVGFRIPTCSYSSATTGGSWLKGGVTRCRPILSGPFAAPVPEQERVKIHP